MQKVLPMGANGDVAIWHFFKQMSEVVLCGKIPIFVKLVRQKLAEKIDKIF